MRIDLEAYGRQIPVQIERMEDTFAVEVNERTYTVQASVQPGGRMLLRINGKPISALTATDGPEIFVALNGQTYRFRRGERRYRPGGAVAAQAESGLVASMPGQVIAVPVEAGAAVRRGDTLVVLEAMKMEQRLTAPGDGTVRAVQVAVGDVVERGQVLVEIDAGPGT